jgi:hypothetical protein
MPARDAVARNCWIASLSIQVLEEAIVEALESLTVLASSRATQK